MTEAQIIKALHRANLVTFNPKEIAEPVSPNEWYEFLRACGWFRKRKEG